MIHLSTRSVAALMALGTAGPATGQPCIPRWSALGPGVTGNSGNVGVHALGVHDYGTGPALYAWGSFTEAGGIAASGFARWDGTRWTAPIGGGGGGSESPASMLVFDDGSGPALYIAAGGVARFNGSLLLPVGATRPPGVALAVFDDGAGPALYSGGLSTSPFNGIGRWDGTVWSTVGNGVTTTTSSAAVRTMAVFDDDGPGPHAPALYISGTFTHAGGLPANSIARWDGQSWSGVGSGFTNGGFLPEVHSMAVFDDGGGPALYVSGFIRSAGGITVTGIARWNGSAWSAVGEPFNSDGRAMLPFDDGSGPALYITGASFGSPPNVLDHGIARWNGTAWVGLGVGLSSPSPPPLMGRGLAVYDAGSGPGLYVGGTFDQAGGAPASNIARFGLPLCPANCDGSRDASGCPTLSVADFGCFLNRFAAGDQRANCDGSTSPPVLNVQDFGCFLNAFAAGCG